MKAQKKENDVNLWNGITLSNDTLRCTVECPAAEVFYRIDNIKHIGFDIYDENGQKISIQETAWKKYTKLKPGVNKLGFYIYGWRSGSKYDNGDYIDMFVDFKWFNVYNSKLKIEPNPLEAELGDEIELEATFEGDLPVSVKYVWDMGDKTDKQSMVDDNTILYEYAEEGEYTVTVEMYNNTTNTLIDKASAQVSIIKANDDLAKLKKCMHIEMDVSFDYYTNATDNVFGGGMNFIRGYSNTTMTWSGTSFTMTYNYSDQDDTGYKNIKKDVITGTVSADARTILSLSYDMSSEYYYSNRWDHTKVERIMLKDIPIVHAKDETVWGWGTVDHFKNELKKDDILSKITDFTYGSYGEHWSSDAMDYVPYDWRWDKSHIVEFWDSFVIKFYETQE